MPFVSELTAVQECRILLVGQKPIPAKELVKRMDKVRRLLVFLHHLYDVHSRDERVGAPGHDAPGVRYRTCEDCLINGFVSRDCENCHGRSEVPYRSADPYSLDTPKTAVTLDPEAARSAAMLRRRDWLLSEGFEERGREDTTPPGLVTDIGRVETHVSSLPAPVRVSLYELLRALERMRQHEPVLYEQVPQNMAALRWVAEEMRGKLRLPHWL